MLGGDPVGGAGYVGDANLVDDAVHGLCRIGVTDIATAEGAERPSRRFTIPFDAVQEHSQRRAVPRPGNVLPDTARQRTVHSEVTSGAISLYVEI